MRSATFFQIFQYVFDDGLDDYIPYPCEHVGTEVEAKYLVAELNGQVEDDGYIEDVFFDYAPFPSLPC